MLKIVHIHSDTKFLDLTERFNEFSFSNTIIIIGENIPCEEVSSFHPILVSHSYSDLRKVVEICSNSDMVVLYELDRVKSYIALNIPQNITIAWRFFGAELYNKKLVNYLSDSSLQFYNTKKEKLSKILSYKIVFRKLMSLIRNRFYSANYLINAIKRVDLFLCLSKYEYDHLIVSWGNLPPFVQIPFRKRSRRNINDKSNLVIIGHSRSIYNNHIDVIKLIENAHCSNQLSFLIPFSYCPENYYTNEIKRLVQISKKNIVLLENFMPYESYFNLVSTAKAAVFNTYRQMALGNIFEFIYSGIKIYLSIHNVIFQWFIDLGLKIFTIEEFASDLESDNLELSSEDKERNICILNHFLLLYSEDHFAIDINSMIKTRMGHTVSKVKKTYKIKNAF